MPCEKKNNAIMFIPDGIAWHGESKHGSQMYETNNNNNKTLGCGL